MSNDNVNINCPRKLIIECETNSEHDIKTIEDDVIMELSCCWNWMQNIKVRDKDITDKPMKERILNILNKRREQIFNLSKEHLEKHPEDKNYFTCTIDTYDEIIRLVERVQE